MPARRHFGSVRKLPSGRYQASYWHETVRHVAPQTFASKSEAQAALAAMEADILRGVWIDPSGGRVTLAKWADGWLTCRTDLRPVTWAKYRHMLDRHVLPILGDQELAKLRPSAVRSWYMGMRARYKTTADDAYRMLRAILTTAVTDGLIPKNPCRVKGAGQARSAERPTASVAEVIAAAKATPDHHRLAVLLPAWCQLRRGEVLGLQRRDIDLLHSTIRIDRSVVRPMSGELVVGPPKTSAGRRSIAVPSNVLPALTQHLERYVGPNPEDWLFTSEAGGPMLPSTLNRIWQRTREVIGRPDLFYHDLRHSGLTWSAASGASIAELMRRGGHANPTAALRYQHATEDRDRAIADALADLAVGTVTPLRTAPARPARARSPKA
ncbi:MAG TPA: site-specific integrase [Acidimicrobiales bacterium]|nr:site-specific integrase [Acidimicrobiales bacterium]